MHRNIPRGVDSVAILVQQWLGVRAHPHRTDGQIPVQRGAGKPPDDRRIADQMGGPGRRHHGEDLVERRTRGYHHRFHPWCGGNVEQRGTGMRRHAGRQYRQARGRRAAPLVARLHPPRQATGRDEKRPIPCIDAPYAAGSAGAEDLLVAGCVRKPLLLSQNALSPFAGEIGRRHDVVPIVLGVLLGHDRDRSQAGDRRRGRVDAAEPPGVKRRPFARVGEQGPQPVVLVTLDLLPGPGQPLDVILEGGVHRVEMRGADALVRRPCRQTCYRIVCHANRSTPSPSCSHWPRRDPWPSGSRPCRRASAPPCRCG